MVRAASRAADAGETVCAPGVYRRRRPERTLAYQTARGWLTTWLARQEAADGELVPAYVERELELSAYLECGIVAHGFARARMGVPIDVRNRLTNHADHSIDGTYNQHDYFSEKRDALIMWDSQIAKIVS